MVLKRLEKTPDPGEKALASYLEQLVKHLPKEEKALYIAELHEHLVLLIADLHAKGFSLEEAQKEALRRFGAVDSISERLKRAWLGSPEGRAGSALMALRFTLICIGLPVLAHLLLVLCELCLSSTNCKSPLSQQTLSLVLGDYLTVHHSIFLPILGLLPLFFSWKLRAKFHNGPVAAGLSLAVALLSLMCFHSEVMETFLWCQMMLCLALGLLLRRQPALPEVYHSLTSS